MKLAQHYRIIVPVTIIQIVSGAIRLYRNSDLIDFSSNNQEPYNQPFSFPELRDALRKSHDSATGPDDILYQMLKHLPTSALSTLLQLFNDIWTTGRFPSSWSLGNRSFVESNHSKAWQRGEVLWIQDFSR
jgi:hypothetical protein